MRGFVKNPVKNCMRNAREQKEATVGKRLSNGQFHHHSEMRAELQIAMQGVGTDALLVCALNVMSVYVLSRRLAYNKKSHSIRLSL